jgi:hypothetical protein
MQSGRVVLENHNGFLITRTPGIFRETSVFHNCFNFSAT